MARGVCKCALASSYDSAGRGGPGLRTWGRRRRRGKRRDAGRMSSMPSMQDRLADRQADRQAGGQTHTSAQVRSATEQPPTRQTGCCWTAAVPVPRILFSVDARHRACRPTRVPSATRLPTLDVRTEVGRRTECGTGAGVARCRAALVMECAGRCDTHTIFPVLLAGP